MARKTAEEKMAALVAKQADLAEQIRKQKAIAAKREKEALEDALKAKGQAVLDAGLGAMPEPELVALLKRAATMQSQQ